MKHFRFFDTFRVNKSNKMTPTRKQFKDFIATIYKAKEKEDKLNKAFELIWDADQGAYVPFYVSPFWAVVYKAFNIMFGLNDDNNDENQLSWWLEEAPKGEAKFYKDKKEHDISDIDDFYDHLMALASQDL